MARTVLLADDSVTAQNMGRRILTDAGYEVITVNNGSAALKKIHETRPDLIVLDVYMPGYGGLEVCQRLKETEATMKIPVLLTVGKMEPFKSEEAKRVHADGHIIKPFDASELLAALTKLEDRIVPQSEDRKSKRSQSEKKSRRSQGGGDPAVNYDDSQSDQISYLTDVKSRRADSSDETEYSTTADLAVSPVQKEEDEPNRRKEFAPDPSRAEFEVPGPVQEETRETVTFAAGPIPEPGMAFAAAKEEPEQQFEIERTAEADTRESAPSSPEFRSERMVESVSEAPSAASTSFANAEASSAQASEASIADTAPAAQDQSTPRWIAESVSLTAEEASSSLEQEMQQAQGPSEPPSTEAQPNLQATESATTSETETQSQPSPETSSETGAAFAAAASASPGASSFADAVSSNKVSEDVEPAAGSESAAAWENWQRIRDSVVSREATEAIAESAIEASGAEVSASDTKTSQPAAEVAPQEPSPALPAKPAGGDALSHIVDNVLAELKPRLLAEIAKQLADGKK